ncbi:MAG: Gfo/Idh/MocA family protein [Limisphaerales bacterium]
MKLRIGFAGIGAMGFSHLKAMHVDHAAHTQAVAVSSRNPSNIKRALEIAPGAKVFRDELALVRSDLDAVFIATPNFTHTPLALEAVRAGKHLFLEKPVGVTRAECRRLLEAVGRTHRVVMVGHELRYSALFQKIKALVVAGVLGRPRLVWTREFRGPFQKKSGDWILDDRQSGGTLVEKNCHHFDLMNWWVGARPKRVCAFGGCAVNFVSSDGKAPERRVQSPESRVPSPKPGCRTPHSALRIEHPVLDHVTVSFEYENGVRGSLQLCLFARDFPDAELEMGIVGDAGELRARIIPPRSADSPVRKPDRSRRREADRAVRAPSRPGRHAVSVGQRARSAAAEGMLELLQWRRGTHQEEPIVHAVASQHGEGWGGHLGFSEIHAAFVRAVREHQRPLTTLPDCVDGTLLAIAAEESVKRGTAVEL